MVAHDNEKLTRFNSPRLHHILQAYSDDGTKTGQFRMKTSPVEPKKQKNGKPFDLVKVGSVSVPIYRHTNIIPQRDSQGRIIYGPPGANGKPKAFVKYESDIYTVAYYQGSKRVRLKFSDSEKAKEGSRTRRDQAHQRRNRGPQTQGPRPRRLRPRDAKAPRMGTRRQSQPRSY